MNKLKQALVAAGLAFAASSASAVTLHGATVDFSFDESLLNGLFGTYSVVGDELSFSPVAFEATAPGTGLPVITQSTTPLITVTAKSGYTLTGANLFEQGGYERWGNTAGDTTVVGAGGNFYVNNLSNPFSAGSLDDVKTWAEAAADTAPTDWWATQSAGLDSAESATVKITNVLLAWSSSPADYASINKTLVSIGIDTTAVPVPAAFWLLASALAGLFTIGRRNSAA
ncbi:VPLPA-CTERM sorting domain-containing protein [Methylococcus sp. EFPC2]|uniref:VPLPA-CTERM sorting domain-containing protein n=1 Tax=Methylococcus sp. EFPC2 TaxID=2812648 RepID=UPI0019676C8C|nr:VPLPA-CTERM sorting domain-containing protein [Methylococcus sp. EFPC2]QSA98918.1 VPLPA-CTERM sorting domain-containing protein [Methylococcus sp. EFPC2]